MYSNLLVAVEVGVFCLFLVKSAEDAIKQIKEKGYIEKVKNIEECLFVGINYSKKDKKHTCMIEKITHV